MQTAVQTTTKTEFAAALRSGKYKQHFGGMMDGKGAFCAMGVFHASQGDEKIEDISISFKINPVIFNRIADMNDTGSTFNEIADYVDSLHDREFYV